MAKEPSKARFYYIKSNHFRVVCAEGAHGGITPHGSIFAAFYNQRGPIPQITTHQINADGTLGDEIRDARVGKEGVIREVEVGVIMDLQTAERFYQWLGEKINLLREISTEKKG
ncbi:MAG: hypothetical protein A3H94_08330 [Acidobacteria bacterium RIFCSPLOWO2_02_FULL_60_20]|nr:MAG: hypothetical protein A3H94_08330 [Acidobacteria bacterium RIFCSPLOWO2_02_FULL_60_20]